jgi:ParB/RepB/Spo0J family partition protein
MELKNIRIDEIREGYHPRKDFKGTEELKEKIKDHGLGNPLVVRHDGDEYVVTDGLRRLRVLKELGWQTVPCVIENVDERTAAHNSYIYNSGDSRIGLNPIEVSLHIKEMRERFDYSVQNLIDLGYAKDDQTVYNKLRLLALPEEIQKTIAEGRLSPTVGYKLARDLARSEDKNSVLRSFEDLHARNDLTVEKYKKWMKNRIIREKGEEKENKVIEIPRGDIPGVFFKDASDMSELPDESVGLVVTSPPYNLELEYEKNVSFEEHLKILDGVLRECARVLEPGRKLCINVADIRVYGTRNNGKPEIQLIGGHYQEILRKYDVRLVDIIIWQKCHEGKKDYNWRSNPQVNYHRNTPHTSYRILNNFEYIYIFEKDGKREPPCDPEISKEEWKQYVDGVWQIPPGKKMEGHPAEFPEEIPRRLIKMYSYEKECVLDCFAGTMTTVKVANELRRIGIGYEKEEKYKPVSMRKLGIKEEDLKEPESNEKNGEFTTDERRDAIRTTRNDLIPEILAEIKDKGERISRLSVPLKRNLSKDDVTVVTVPIGDDSPPTSPPASPQVVKADDYEDGDGALVPAPSTYANAA